MIEKSGISRKIFLVFAVFILLLVAFVCIAPMWYVVMASFSTGRDLYQSTGFLWLPAGKFSTNGYKFILEMKDVWKGYAMTLVYVVGGTGFGVVITVFGGYYLAKKHKLAKPMSIYVLITMMFSGGLIPTYIVMQALYLDGTIWAIIIPGCTNAFYIMMATTAFRGIPESIVEAAEIDGAGHYRIMFQICVPMIKGIIMVVAMYSVVMQWNSWFPASIYLSTKANLWPLQLVMRDMLATYSEASILQSPNIDFSKFTIQYVLIIISTLPILIACPFFQKYFGNMQIGGVKE